MILPRYQLIVGTLATRSNSEMRPASARVFHEGTMPGVGGQRLEFVGKQPLDLMVRCFAAPREYISISVVGIRRQIFPSASILRFATGSNTLDTRKSISRSRHCLLVYGPFNRHSVHTLGDAVRDIFNISEARSPHSSRLV